MNCKRAQELWDDKCDGVLSTADQASLAIHLRGCPTCRRYHQQMDELTGALLVLKDNTESIGESRAVSSLRHRRWIRVWQGGRVAAAVALVVGAGLYMSQLQRAVPPGLGPTTTPMSETPGPDLIAARAVSAELELVGASAARYIAVERETSQSKVQVFWLFQTGEKPVEQP